MYSDDFYVTFTETKDYIEISRKIKNIVENAINIPD